ncbi:hypothetical protein ASZ90_017102 [hydrocarbon metagenome]|uniref:Uncharacterized protein n=1 Tax=hydrocarbon metagenome TaxID=938273 RepID=A0A0W8EA85_9ZZZZ
MMLIAQGWNGHGLLAGNFIQSKPCTKGQEMSDRYYQYLLFYG